jgi:endoglucanase
MTENKILCGIELLERLCLEFGPSGCEEAVADEIARQLSGVATLTRDKVGNLYARVNGEGEGLPTVMLSAHTDEVGFMVKYIEESGYIRFAAVGGIDPRVLCGRRVIFRGENGDVGGVIASKAIHHQSAEERKKATKINDMYIDIGATSRADAEKYLALGDYGVFDSDFVRFGENEGFIKGKAIDDRLGCAVMIELLRRLKDEGKKLPFDLVCAFTVREEIGRSGAQVAAQRVRPDYAVVLESTAIADLPDVKPNSRVAKVGGGGVISLVDRSTIYDRELVDGMLDIAKRRGISAQVKKYVSGGNDAAHIHKSGTGVRTVAVSAATRYLHSASCVASIDDYEAIKELIYAFLCEYGF